jgi:hypothetical protein
MTICILGNHVHRQTMHCFCRSALTFSTYLSDPRPISLLASEQDAADPDPLRHSAKKFVNIDE